jgi:hypothetical protein
MVRHMFESLECNKCLTPVVLGSADRYHGSAKQGGQGEPSTSLVVSLLRSSDDDEPDLLDVHDGHTGASSLRGKGREIRGRQRTLAVSVARFVVRWEHSQEL